MLRDAELLHICYNLFLSISYFTSMRYAVHEQGVQTLLDCVLNLLKCFNIIHSSAHL